MGRVGVPQTPGLFAPADDRNNALTANCRRDCSGRRMPGATVHPSPKRKSRATWPPASVSAAPAVHPRAVGDLHRVTICREL